jgi:hypothetical protein
MLYDVYVQGKKYRSIEADNTQSVLTAVTVDLQNDRVPDRDHSKPPKIVVRPAHLPPINADEAEELFRPQPVNTSQPAAVPDIPEPPVSPAPTPVVPEPVRPRAKLRKK